MQFYKNHAQIGSISVGVSDSANFAENLCTIGCASSTCPCDLNGGNSGLIFLKNPPTMKPPSLVNAIVSKPDLDPAMFPESGPISSSQICFPVLMSSLSIYPLKTLLSSEF